MILDINPFFFQIYSILGTCLSESRKSDTIFKINLENIVSSEYIPLISVATISNQFFFCSIEIIETEKFPPLFLFPFQPTESPVNYYVKIIFNSFFLFLNFG